jgi:hypothetical protein
LEHPDVTGIADEIEAFVEQCNALIHVGHKTPDSFAMLAGRRDGVRDGVGKNPVAEIAGDAERTGQVEMADPEAIDTIDGGDRFGIFNARRRFDLLSLWVLMLNVSFFALFSAQRVKGKVWNGLAIAVLLGSSFAFSTWRTEIGLIRVKQEIKGIQRHGVAIGGLDWVKLAQGFGADGVVVENENGLQDALGAALASGRTTVVAARIDGSGYVDQFNALREL